MSNIIDVKDAICALGVRAEGNCLIKEGIRNKSVIQYTSLVCSQLLSV